MPRAGVIYRPKRIDRAPAVTEQVTASGGGRQHVASARGLITDGVRGQARGPNLGISNRSQSASNLSVASHTERDELAPSHSITSSARASSVGGTSSPSALAVLRLMTNSIFVGCSIGRSLGFAPLRILST